MNRIEAMFRGLRKKGKRALIVYITAGDPSLAVTERLVRVLEAAGADMVELGIPFSDPLADGPVIQAASQRALRNRVTMAKVFALARRLRAKTAIPLAFMTYYNPVLRYGPKRFVADCARCGVDGVIVPDLPVEEAAGLVRLARAHRVASIFLAAPTSPAGRIRAIARASTGFIYYVSLTGVTGQRKALAPELAARCRAIRSMTAKPLCVGFGVSTPAQARLASRVADGVIVGSAVVKIIGEKRDIVKRVASFTKGLAKAVHGAR